MPTPAISNKESALTPLESDRLTACEETIKAGAKTFIEVGNALLTIRDERLYRREFGTFEDYCNTRWDMGRNRANRLIAAAETVQNLVPMGTTPDNERQARPLAGLPPDEQASAWQEAVETAPDGKVTAKHVQEVVDRRTGEVLEDVEIVTTKIDSKPAHSPSARGKFEDGQTLLATFNQIEETVDAVVGMKPKQGMLIEILTAARAAHKKLGKLIASLEKEI